MRGCGQRARPVPLAGCHVPPRLQPQGTARLGTPQHQPIPLSVPTHSPQVLFNKFFSAVNFKPTIATVLSPSGIEKQMEGEQGSKLDVYDLEVGAPRLAW